MKTINIKGKEYIPVNERLLHFRSNEDYKMWQIHEEIVSVNDNEGIFKVTIYDNNGVVMASAHSQEYRDSSYINKTSFLENGFTSALGRALGYLGIGIDVSIASANEVGNAVINVYTDGSTIFQDDKKWLTEQQLNATLKGTAEQAQKVLGAFKMKKEYREKISNKFNI
jgi:hypothetical protein